jgi:hypothetical protein
MIKKLTVERDLKRAQHAKAVSDLEKQTSAGAAAAAATTNSRDAPDPAVAANAGDMVDRMDES